jgi:hypothetical protein
MTVDTSDPNKLKVLLSARVGSGSLAAFLAGRLCFIRRKICKEFAKRLFTILTY